MAMDPTDITGVAPEEPPSHGATNQAKAAGNSMMGGAAHAGGAEPEPKPSEPKGRSAGTQDGPNIDTPPPEPKPLEATPKAQEAAKQAGEEMMTPTVATGEYMSALSKVNPLAPINWAEHAPAVAYHTGARVAAGLRAIASVGPQHLEAAGNVLKDQGAPLPGEAVQNVERVYNAAIDPHAIAKSVQNIYEQDNAQGAFLRTISLGSANIDGLTPAQLAAQAKQRGDIWSTALELGANPLNAVGMGAGGLAFKAAVFMGPSVAAALASPDPNQRNSGLVWSAVTGMLLGGTHLPEGATQELASQVERWPALAGLVSHWGRKAQEVKSTLVNGPKLGEDYQPFHSYVEDELQKGGFQGFEKTLATAAQEGTRKAIGTVYRTADGRTEIEQTAKDQAQSLYKKLGVGDAEEVVTKMAAGGFNDAQSKLIQKNWASFGLPYDLKAIGLADDPLRDPRAAVAELGQAGKDVSATQAHLGSSNHYLHQIYSGIFSTTARPEQSLWRSLIGNHRATNLVHQEWMGSALKALDEVGIVPGKSEELTKAVEGDAEAYGALPPQGKAVVDSFRLITNALRRESKDTEYANNFVGNWFPRVDHVAEDTSKAGMKASTRAALQTEQRGSRRLGWELNDEGQVFQAQRFKTVQEANDAIKMQRQTLVEDWLDATKAIRNPSQAVKHIRDLVESGNMKGARASALKHVQAMLPLKETDFLTAASRTLARQAGAVKTAQALKEWERTIVTFTDKEGVTRQGAAAVAANNSREMAGLRDLGYRRIDDPKFQKWLFAPHMADLLERATTHGSALSANAASKAALDLEGLAVSTIMWSPAMHAMNIAGRASILWARHPIDFTLQLMHGFLHPGAVDDAAYALRSEAFNAGVLPRSRNLGFTGQVQGTLTNVLGDDPEAEYNLHAQPAGKLNRILHEHHVAKAHDTMNNYFWSFVNDFGVMAYHVEKKSALARGLDEESARLWAARRANTYAGFVAPEDTNPLWHDIGRALFFAPNWWRTWAEMLVPLYRRSGVAMDENQVQKMAYDQARTLAAMFAAQKVSGNVANHLLSGHWQNQNDPGNQDRIEITNPAILEALKKVNYPGAAAINPKTGRNDTTGAVMTLENPLARGQRDIEEGVGLQSGEPGWSPGDVPGGLAKVAAARLSPFLSAAGALANIDVYRSIADNQLVHADPNSPQHPSAASLVYAALMLTPGGLSVPYSMQQAIQTDGLQKVGGPFGTKIPKAIIDATGGVAGDVAQTAFSWMTGINPPYAIAAKTRGQSPSDQQWLQLAQDKATHHTQMLALDQEAWGGQITPGQWLQRYQAASSQYSTQVNDVFHGASNDAFGTEALAGQWEALYGEATMKDGSLDYQKLDSLQAKFEHDHSSEQIASMNQLLSKNENQYKMLGLYHTVTNQYKSFQETTAAKLGIDVQTLRSQIGELDTLYGNTIEYERYLVSHRQLMDYETIKKTQFERSPAGMMWGLFNQSPTAYRYLLASGEDTHQLEREVASGQTTAPASSQEPAPTAQAPEPVGAAAAPSTQSAPAPAAPTSESAPSIPFYQP